MYFTRIPAHTETQTAAQPSTNSALERGNNDFAPQTSCIIFFLPPVTVEKIECHGLLNLHYKKVIKNNNLPIRVDKEVFRHFLINFDHRVNFILFINYYFFFFQALRKYILYR